MAISLREFNYDPALRQQDELDGISNSFQRSSWETYKAVCLDWKWGKILVVLKWMKSTRVTFFSKFYFVNLRKWTPTFKALVMPSLRPLAIWAYIPRLSEFPVTYCPSPGQRCQGAGRDEVFHELRKPLPQETDLHPSTSRETRLSFAINFLSFPTTFAPEISNLINLSPFTLYHFQCGGKWDHYSLTL